MLSGRNAELHDVEPGATYDYHCQLKVFTAAITHINNINTSLFRAVVSTDDERSHQYKQQTCICKYYDLCFVKYTP